MSLTHAIATTEAEAVRLLAERLMDVYADVVDLIAHNSGLSIDWANATKPAFLEEDASGNLAGLPVTRQQVANAIGSFAAIQTLMGNGHLGNLNLVSRPVGKR
jgi:hypothetical protein